MILPTGFPAYLAANPDASLLTLFAGVLLIYLECNRPGSVLPGCLGALLTLLSINAFTHMPLRQPALALIVAGVALVVADLTMPVRNPAAILGTISLIIGLRTLVQPFASAHVHTPIAVVLGSSFAFTTVWLARVALRARRNKRSLSPDLSIRSASQRRTG